MQSKRTTVYRHADLTRLLHPASVAVIGASTRAGSFGERVLQICSTMAVACIR